MGDPFQRPQVNPAHALDGGIPSLFHLERRWPAASDVRRWTTSRAMNPFKRLCLAITGGSLILTGCSHPAPSALNNQSAGARLNEAEVLRIASQVAERDGRHLSDYKPPEAHYEFTQKDKSWSVFFDGKVPMPGNHFSVSVDDQTGKAQLFPGR